MCSIKISLIVIAKYKCNEQNFKQKIVFDLPCSKTTFYIEFRPVNFLTHHKYIQIPTIYTEKKLYKCPGQSHQENNFIFFIEFKNPIPIIIIINLNQNLYYHTIKKSSEHTRWINTTDTTYSFISNLIAYV